MTQRSLKDLETFTKQYTYVICRRLGRLRETANPEHFGGLQEGTQIPLVDVHFAVVDELDQSLEVIEHYILQHYHGVFARCALSKNRHNAHEFRGTYK